MNPIPPGRWVFEQPVGREAFVFAVNVYLAASAGLSGYGLAASMPEGMRVTPEAVGLTAVAHAFEHLAATDMQSMVSRVQAWAQGVASARDDARFKTHVVDAPDQTHVSIEFCEAYAICEFAGPQDERSIPLDVVLAMLSNAGVAEAQI